MGGVEEHNNQQKDTGSDDEIDDYSKKEDHRNEW